jgi:hypothetical protein
LDFAPPCSHAVFRTDTLCFDPTGLRAQCNGKQRSISSKTAPKIGAVGSVVAKAPPGRGLPRSFRNILPARVFAAQSLYSAAKTAYATEHYVQRLPESVGNYYRLKMETKDAEIIKRGVEQITREDTPERKKPGAGNEIAGRVFRYTST